MVYKLPQRLKTSFKGPCAKASFVKRPICIGASIEQRPWKPTVPKDTNNERVRGKPCYHMIPPYMGPNVVDSKKKSAPAYSLGRQIRERRNYAEDGPAKVNIRGWCNKGPQTAPAFSLKWREKGVTIFQSPPANKYVIENSFNATTPSKPQFSFGKRPAVIKSLPTPAPNVYNLPPVFGTAKEGQVKAAPAFTMLGRAKPRKIPSILFPGPGDYEANYRYAQKLSPRYTLHCKHKVINDDHMKPGPAAHCPENYIRHKSVPAPSFGIKHTPFLGERKAHLIPERKSSTTQPEWLLQAKKINKN